MSLSTRGALVLFITAAACDDSVRLTAERPPANEAPAPASPDPGLWRESFDHRGQLGRLEGSAILDSNRGHITLPADPLPALDAEGELALIPGAAAAGVARAADITLEAGETLVAPDALELQAADTVRLAGTVRAGPGGVLISAARRIEITGRIVAQGPVELLIRDPDGVVAIDGEVVSRAGGPDSGDARIEVRGRGALRIRGRLAAESALFETDAPPPSVHVAVYGPVELAATAELEAGPEGTVELGTNAHVLLEPGLALADGAAWTIGARAFEIGAQARLEVGPFALTAETTATFGEGSSVISGGRELSVIAGTISLGGGAELLGAGPEGTSLRLEAASRLEVEEGARVESLTPTCGREGQVIIRVAGPWVGLGRASIRGAPLAPSCPDADPSGVLIEAHAYEGVHPGLPDGSATFGAPRVDPQLRITVPPIAASIAGRWISVPFPTAGGAPVLEVLDLETPPGTRVRVALGIARGPNEEARDFVAWDFGDPEAWAVHAGAPYFAVRVSLEGRRFDAPTVRLLELRFR